MSRYRNFLLTSIALLIGILGSALLLEGGSYLFLRRDGAELRRERFREEYRLAAEGRDSSWLGFIGRNPGAVRKAHPYFGHVFVDGNNHGFLSKQDFPYRRKPGEFVIGIFGGSTAMHWADHLNRSAAWDRIKVAGQGGLKPVILNFALSGMRQPQQFHVAAKFLDTLDLALVLDGWNESVLDSCPWGPPELPQDYRILFNSASDLSRIEALRRAAGDFRRLSRRLASPWLYRSFAARLYWDRAQRRLASSLQGTQPADEPPGRSFASECEGDLNDVRFQVWRKYSLQMDALARLQRVPLFQFLQPNPYLPDAKPLDEEESRTVQWSRFNSSLPDSQGRRSEEFRKRYLKNPIPQGTDLSGLFRGESRTVYIDSYSHLNELGYGMLSQAVRRRLITAGVFSE